MAPSSRMSEVDDDSSMVDVIEDTGVDAMVSISYHTDGRDVLPALFTYSLLMLSRTLTRYHTIQKIQTQTQIQQQSQVRTATSVLMDECDDDKQLSCAAASSARNTTT